jgi:hypothetical protein
MKAFLLCFLLSIFYPLLNCHVQEVKGITAQCSTLAANADNLGFCTYSVGFFDAAGAGYSATATVLINGIGQAFSFQVSGIPYFYNFAVESGDQIVVEFDPNIVDDFSAYFMVYNKADGGGPQNVIANSSARTFAVLNQCTSSCTYSLRSTSFPAQWGGTFTITVVVNSVSFGSFNGASTSLNFAVASGDSIEFQLGPGATNPTVPVSAFVVDTGTSATIFSWYSGAYFTPLISANPCTLHLPPAPFGTRLYPILAPQQAEFLNSVTVPESSRWTCSTLSESCRLLEGDRSRGGGA